MLNENGKLKKVNNIDLELINALEEIFADSVRGISTEKEIYVKQGNLEVVDFLKTQYELMNGKK